MSLCFLEVLHSSHNLTKQQSARSCSHITFACIKRAAPSDGFFKKGNTWRAKMWDIGGGGKKRENKYCLHPNYVNNKYTADGEPQTSEPLQTPK